MNIAERALERLTPVNGDSVRTMGRRALVLTLPEGGERAAGDIREVIEVYETAGD